jgi:hypothetical protein
MLRSWLNRSQRGGVKPVYQERRRERLPKSYMETQRDLFSKDGESMPLL